ncbi:C-type lectin mosGCTL-7 [Leptinotarsa decemlineata]|uniref:C-type lectin mosGCTL-7 n=1 Tax=Leptinotarsa decemlineata TaxID=7539 RepID=UPI003D3073D5
MLLTYVLGGLIIHCIYCAVPTKQYMAVADPVSHEVVIGTLPSFKLHQFGNKLYYFGAIYKGDYNQAMQFCNFHDMHMVSIETKEENDFLWTSLKSFLAWGEFRFWTSGTTTKEHLWFWMSTGKPVTWANWFPNQPDNTVNENCIEAVYLNTNGALLWNDDVCSKSNFVICETTIPKSILKMVPGTSTNFCNITFISLAT